MTAAAQGPKPGKGIRFKSESDLPSSMRGLLFLTIGPMSQKVHLGDGPTMLDPSLCGAGSDRTFGTPYIDGKNEFRICRACAALAQARGEQP